MLVDVVPDNLRRAGRRYAVERIIDEVEEIAVAVHEQERQG
jgi:hypothetical protein